MSRPIDRMPWRCEVGELVVVAEQVQPRTHGRQDLVDRRLAGVDALARRIKRTRRLVRQEDVDARERLARQHFVAHEMPPLVVAALAELERRGRRLAPLRRRQRAAGV